jgi:uncharacterized protein (TIGR02452 family)
MKFFLLALTFIIIACLSTAFSSDKEIIEQKKYRAVIYQETKQACLKGYTLIALQNELSSPIFRIPPGELKKMKKGSLLKKEPSPLRAPGLYDKTEIKVYNSGSIELGKLLKEKGFNPVVLNFANKSKVGGGVERGALAQEEDLFRRSSYFLSLDIKYNPYLHKQMQGKYLIPEFGAIYTPNVYIIRGPERDGFPFIHPFQLDFIACAAYNRNVNDHDAPKSEKDYLEGMRKKIRAILRLGASTHHDAVVLGAFGCGAFKNDPKVIAPLFREIIHEPEFKGQYKLIAFAIPESGILNHQVFKNCLNGIVLESAN